MVVWSGVGVGERRAAVHSPAHQVRESKIQWSSSFFTNSTYLDAVEQSSTSNQMSADGPRLVDLGSDVLAQVTNSLTHLDWARLAQVCRVFHSAVDDARSRCNHANVDTLQLSSPFILSYTLGQCALRSTLNLHSLVLRGIAIDDSQLDSLTHLKQLQILNIASTDVTSLGLRCLWSLQSINELDLTFCPYVSYNSVLELRQHCPNLKLIRRQPKWLDGVFVTPWGEIHTYYPCGAFSFTRVVN